MQIIGEKINGTLKEVKTAIRERNASVIQNLARQQVESGADLVDVNAGTLPAEEPEALTWLVRTVQDEVDTPLCLDSANPQALAMALQEIKQTPMINSISGERARLDGILPLVSKHGCTVIALAMDEKGIPKGVDERLAVIRSLIGRTRDSGLPDEKVYIDPLVMTLSTNTESGVITLETMRAVRSEFPKAHLCAGLSNISFGLPARHLVNRVFLTLALEAGLDAAILDPFDQELRGELLAAELVLGRDRHCLSYTRSYREGRIGHKKK
ncbi:MAG TPA: methyltetrahydrofolate cobalamin methyltransferase [Thermodesulfobacteriota bacterium]|nr:methyltetrahydrofolate cobalamin methyltransferase [Thermodesulfobacteriota bacterium]